MEYVEVLKEVEVLKCQLAGLFDTLQQAETTKNDIDHTMNKLKTENERLQSENKRLRSQEELNNKLIKQLRKQIDPEKQELLDTIEELNQKLNAFETNPNIRVTKETKTKEKRSFSTSTLPKQSSFVGVCHNHNNCPSLPSLDQSSLTNITDAKFTASESNYGSMRSTLYSTGTTSSYYEEDATESLDFDETGNFASIISGVTDGVDDEDFNQLEFSAIPKKNSFSSLKESLFRNLKRKNEKEQSRTDDKKVRMFDF